LWRYYLAFLEDRGQLIRPLGQWIDITHQHWHYHVDAATEVLYHIDGDTVRRTSPCSSNRKRLRSGRYYDLQTLRESSPPTTPTIPVTLLSYGSPNELIYKVQPSPSPLAKPPMATLVQSDIAAYITEVMGELLVDSSIIKEAITRGSLTVSCSGMVDNTGKGIYS
jgi:hypothetical protein